MPIEREFKYILSNSEMLETILAKKSETTHVICQGYLNKGCRVRSVQPISRNGKPKGPVRYLFTYKHNLSSDGGILEIETYITKWDFELAWGDASQKVFKTRYELFHEGHTWEIDTLRDAQEKTYLIIAECEVDPEHGRPAIIHPLVEKNLIYEVEENDPRFTNRKLSDPAYATDLLESVLKVKVAAPPVVAPANPEFEDHYAT